MFNRFIQNNTFFNKVKSYTSTVANVVNASIDGTGKTSMFYYGPQFFLLVLFSTDLDQKLDDASPSLKIAMGGLLLVGSAYYSYSYYQEGKSNKENEAKILELSKEVSELKNENKQLKRDLVFLTRDVRELQKRLPKASSNRIYSVDDSEISYSKSKTQKLFRAAPVNQKPVADESTPLLKNIIN